jgi:5-methylcytosine-specific restriction endonuclease McrA
MRKYEDRKEYMRAYQRQWVAARRAAFFSGKTCATCGSTDKLELDHIDRTTKVDHKVWSWSEVRRSEELAKCQVLCRPCHEIKSIRDRGLYEHNNHRYSNGCRCDVCKEAHAKNNREWRRRRDARLSAAQG